MALNGEGNTLIVGAPFEDSNAKGVHSPTSGSLIGSPHLDNTNLNSGAAYLYTYNVNGWSQLSYIKASNSDHGDNFGHAVDINDDGNLIAISASLEQGASTYFDGNSDDNSLANAGAAYSFVINANNEVIQQHYIKTITIGADYFGYSLSISGDGDSLAVGSIFEASNSNVIDGNQKDNSAPQAGAAYIYDLN